ncbi:hypothetical protein ABZ885_34635, partial [Kitasatospora sp. NPDC047058]
MTTRAVPDARPEQAGPARRPLALLTAVGGQNLSLLGALALVLALFGWLNGNFLSWDNIQVIAEAATIAGLLAVVQTVVIICGGLDISVGSQAGLASVVSAMVFTSAGSSAPLGIGVLGLLAAGDGQGGGDQGGSAAEVLAPRRGAGL